jgi:L-threonylcarbamoyladenylate synthase
VETLLTNSPEQAAAFIRRGGLAAFPTETVYGLGANIFNQSALARIFEAKGRPADNPLIAHVANAGQVDLLTSDLTPSARILLDTFAPGPITVVVRKSAEVPLMATAGLDTIGIRIPRLPIAREFLKACGVPVAAPSANLSGRPSPTRWRAVMDDLNGRIDCILQGAEAEIGLESTVVDCTGESPVVLRAGSVSLEQIREVIPNVSQFSASDTESFRSPGMKYRHYSPRARVVLDLPTSTDASSGFIGLRTPSSGEFGHATICGDVSEYARSLYEFFRECDRLGIQTIYCEPVSEDGIGMALMDRIRRAADLPV